MRMRSQSLLQQSKDFLFIFTMINTILLFSLSECHGISKRFLIFPQQAPTRHQFIAGIGIPADLELESLTVGYVLKAEYFLPYNATQLRTATFVPEFKNKRSLKQAYKWNRWNIYNAIEDIIDRIGYDGPECLMRSICEYAALPFTDNLSIIEDLIHVLLLPSTSSNELNVKTKQPYILAEEHGKSGAACHELYKQCPKSLLNTFSIIFHEKHLSGM